MKMIASSQTAFLVLAGIFAILSGMILTPDGRLLPLFIAGLIAVIILFVGSSRAKRFIALIILAVVVYLFIPAWQQYRSHLDQYRNRVSPSDKVNVLH
jgi:membrane protein implicated in regulation of membrane protease activity